MSPILFFDPTCQQPYDTQTLQRQASGGTEASLTRIADALDAFVVQHNRTAACGRYLAPTPIAGIGHVVLNRDPRALPLMRKLYPQARLYLWLHDRLYPGSTRGRRLASMSRQLCEAQVSLICVSDSQRRDVEATLYKMGVSDRVPALTIYNPVDDALAPDGSPVDESKLVFFSAPNKGLKFTLDAFRALRRQMPDLHLAVGNPGYKIGPATDIAGVRYLGAQPQYRIHAEVRTALCTFFPNFVIPETFGLVFAESKALGTPVLTHDCGAAAEILGDSRQVLPVRASYRIYEHMLSGLAPRWRAAPARFAARCGLFDAYIERIRAWRSGTRPQTGPDPRFHLTAVANQWRALFAANDGKPRD